MYTEPQPQLSDKQFTDYLSLLDTVATGRGLPRDGKPFYLDNPSTVVWFSDEPLVQWHRYGRKVEMDVIRSTDFEGEFEDELYFDYDMQYAAARYVKRITVKLGTEMRPVRLAAYRQTAAKLRGYRSGHKFEPLATRHPPSPFGEDRFRRMTTEYDFPDASHGFWRSGSATKWNNYRIGERCE